MAETLIGTRIQNFRVVGLIGTGGMGEVYAGYDETLERRVALKVIRAEHRLDAVSKARFLREARILSQLAHPGICLIHEYIETPDADFLVLELISGQSLTERVKGGLDHRRKLRVAGEIASVLVAAHGKGVVHRDLKPDNVMITDAGPVKVLDFGLSCVQQEESTIPIVPASRLVEGGSPSSAPPPGDDGTIDLGEGRFAPAASVSAGTVTTIGTVMGTIDYMSPEQARGEPATSASDIYSFGLVLQEMFTGERARDRSGLVHQRIERASRGETRPVSGLDPDLASLIERMKAIVPASRPTAIEALDRCRWIERKPARKRKRLLTAAAIVTLAVFSIGATLQAVLIARERNRANVERDRASQEAERERKMLSFLTGTFEVASPRRGKGPSATAREIIDHAAGKVGSVEDQPLLEASLLSTLAQIYDGMGIYDSAEPLARRALALREKLLGPDDREVGSSLNQLGKLCSRRGRYAEAGPFYRRALAIREKEFGPDHPQAATIVFNLAILERAEGRFPAAESLYNRALRTWERAFGPDAPEVADSLDGLAGCDAEQGKFPAAEPLFRRALAIREKALGPDHPDLAMSLCSLASVYSNEGRPAEAEPLFRRAVEIQEKVLGPDHPELAATLNNFAGVHLALADAAEAERLYRRALAIWEKTVGSGHPEVAGVLYNLGCLAAKQGKRSEALAYLRRALPGGQDTPWMANIGKDADLASLHGDPEFGRIVAAVEARAAGRSPAPTGADATR